MDYQISTESTIVFSLMKYEIISQDELEKKSKDRIPDVSHHCNIYFVCRRPKITVKQAGFKYDDRCIYLTFLVHHKSHPVKQEISIPNPRPGALYKLNTKLPFTFFEIEDENGNILIRSRASHFIDTVKRELPIFEMLNMEILFIGKSIKEQTKANRVRRYISNQTLQNIWFEQNNLHEDKEIYFLLCQFNTLVSQRTYGYLNGIAEKEPEDTGRLSNILKNSDYNHLISIAEAGLINYFKPIYNIPFYDIFLDKEHRSYKFFLKKDFNALRVEFDFGVTGTKIYSGYVAPSMCCNKLFHLEKSTGKVIMKEDER